MPSMSATHGGMLYYVVKVNRQEENGGVPGLENPFRPGGQLSREAEQMVELIKEGKPITPSSSGIPEVDTSPEVTIQSSSVVDSCNATPVKKQISNGSNAVPLSPGPIDIKRTTVEHPADATQVEHVVIKKKQKCCTIQ